MSVLKVLLCFGPKGLSYMFPFFPLSLFFPLVQLRFQAVSLSEGEIIRALRNPPSLG